MVAGPVPLPREAELFPFRRAVVVATACLLLLALGAAQWMVRRHLASARAQSSTGPVMVESLRTPGEEAPASTSEPILGHPENLPPPAPRPVSPLAVPALAVKPEELVDLEWKKEVPEPFDSEVSEADNEPFPTARIESPKPKPPARPTNRKTKPPARPSKSGSSSSPSAKPAVRAAQVVRRAQPRYPTSARRAGVEGRVVLTVEVRTNGRVGSVRVAKSSGSAALDSAAISAVKRWAFTPETRGGKPVTSLLNVPFNFSLR